VVTLRLELMCVSLLQTVTVAAWAQLTVATDLSWPIATVTMRLSRDGQPQCQQPMKLVATGERWCHLCPSLLWSTVAMGNDCPSLLWNLNWRSNINRRTSTELSHASLITEPSHRWLHINQQRWPPRCHHSLIKHREERKMTTMAFKDDNKCKYAAEEVEDDRWR
jgi:hypothetical protein